MVKGGSDTGSLISLCGIILTLYFFCKEELLCFARLAGLDGFILNGCYAHPSYTLRSVLLFIIPLSIYCNLYFPLWENCYLPRITQL